MTRRLLTFDDLAPGFMDPLDYGGLSWRGGRKHPFVTTTGEGEPVVLGSRFGIRSQDAPFDVLAADIMPSWQNYEDYTLVLRGKRTDGEKVKEKYVFAPEQAETGQPLAIDLSEMTDLVRFNIKGRAAPDRTGELSAVDEVWLDNLELDIHNGAAARDWAL